MHEIQYSFVLLLLVLVTFGTGIITKYVCTGDSVQVFENIVFDSQDTVVSLYMNQQTHILIAQWEVQNLTITPNIQQGYKEKVYLNKDGSIWIQNVNHWDEENYFIEYGKDTSYVKYEVDIRVMVAPTKNCKPKITHHERVLISSLAVEDCGIPVASVQWLDYPVLPNTSEPVIDLPPGNEAGTYYACIKGPALECAKISALSDYCSSYTIGGRISHDTTITWSPENETQGTYKCIHESMIISILVIEVCIAVTAFVCYFHKYGHYCCKMSTQSKVDKEVQTDTILQTTDAKISEKSSQLQRDRKKRFSANIQFLDPRKDNMDDSFRETCHLEMQSISIDEPKTNPEGDKPKPKSVEISGVPVMEDSSSEEECNKPLIDIHGD